MAIKKSELYSSLWASCDALRGGMDASQYKDYVLALLFIKYVSDKYVGVPFAPIVVPKGASFADMVALKGKPDIGDQVNKKIVAPLFDANRLTDAPDFNDANKLGGGALMKEGPKSRLRERDISPHRRCLPPPARRARVRGDGPAHRNREERLQLESPALHRWPGTGTPG